MTGVLQDKVAVVTGSGSGIGRATACLFAAQGAKVVVCDIDESGGNQTVSMIKAASGEASFTRTDVGDENSVARMVAFAIDRYGKLDAAVNNAGIEPEFVLMHELSLEAWEKNLRVNLTGVFLCLKHELIHMRKAGEGSIVNIASIAAVKSVPKAHVYAAAKRGVLSLTACAAVEAGPVGVRVNAINPGGIKGRMMTDVVAKHPEIWESYKQGIPMGDAGEPETIAQAALYLASSQSSYVTGQYFSVDGGITA